MYVQNILMSNERCADQRRRGEENPIFLEIVIWVILCIICFGWAGPSWDSCPKKNSFSSSFDSIPENCGVNIIKYLPNCAVVVGSNYMMLMIKTFRCFYHTENTLEEPKCIDVSQQCFHTSSCFERYKCDIYNWERKIVI